MASIIDPVLDAVDVLLAYISSASKATVDANCELQTADSENSLVTSDGSLLSVIEVHGVSNIVGPEEFKAISEGLLGAMRPFLSIPGHSAQILFEYDPEVVINNIRDNYAETMQSLKVCQLDLDDLIDERLTNMARYTAAEKVYVCIWTRLQSLTNEQQKRVQKDKQEQFKNQNMPVFRYTQNVIAAIPDLRDSHETNVRSFISTCTGLGLKMNMLDVHEAVKTIRYQVDPTFTEKNWRAVLPGDRIRPKLAKSFEGDIADVLWPSLSKQIFPRDGYNISMDTCKVGDRAYSTVFIDLFPKELMVFNALMGRVLQSAMPWRISFMLDSDGLSSMKVKKALTTLLSFSSSQNRLISNGIELLEYIDLNTDDTVVKLRVALCTWSQEHNIRQLKVRTAMLARAVQGWGSCDISQSCGDAFEGYTSTLLAFNSNSVATTTVASLTDTITMLPLYRPTSPWERGALLFRSPDGKLWPYQPGSALQTTCIDLIYARPGSGKSVLSNAMNLALCLMGGLKRLPRIAVIDIGPSSSGLVSLLKEALPQEKRNQVGYFRLRMTPEYSINPFDTQLGSRFPMPSERSFLVNFVTLLATPVGNDTPYDGLSDMVGLVVDEVYKSYADDASPHIYTPGTEEILDAILQDIGFVSDSKTSWWEVTDALFMAGFIKEAYQAQRYAMPILSDLASICRTTAVEDLYGKITTPTGESLIAAFTRMISSSVREYPILSKFTQFEIGDARVVSLDLDEVAKAGGAAADRQTAVMYMLARYVVSRDFYTNIASLSHLPKVYLDYHEERVSEAQEDPKRLVMDEFHRTSKAQAVREQVLQDMREGRKWRVQVSLLSQSIDDFDPIMIDFATSIFIMDAGPEQSIQKTKQVFGLSNSATDGLRNFVRGPGPGGATILAMFSTKMGVTTQLVTLTLGPVELWAFSTTTEDYLLRNKLYAALGPKEARIVLARIFPGGSATKFLQKRAEKVKESGEKLDKDKEKSLVDDLADEILEEYKKNPNVKKIIE